MSLGKEIHRTHDEWGPIHVYQDADRRTLAFGNRVEQSCVRLNDPARLEYVYTQAMALSLLFNHAERIAVLGVGGGALVRAIRQQLPGAIIHAVEQRAEVVRLAREYFCLEDAPQIHWHLGDAVDFMANSDRRFDLQFTDLYLAEGMDGRQAGSRFLRDCRECLTSNGLLVVNLWGSDYESTRRASEHLREVFEQQVLFLNVQGGNLIAYAFTDGIPGLNRKPWFDVAQQLGMAMRIPLHKLARNLWRQNAEALGMARGNR